LISLDNLNLKPVTVRAPIIMMPMLLLLLLLLPLLLLASAAGAAPPPAAPPPAAIRSYSELGGGPYNVTYDARSLRVGGRPLLAFSGSMHYPRSTPALWPKIMASMKASGLNTLDSYVFWNFHVRSNSSADRAAPDYSGRGNVTLFLQLAAEADLFVIWRIGPYINAEWLNGGYPAWVMEMCTAAGTKWKAAEEPYMSLTTEWMKSHVETVRPYFATNGGPIILMQIDNELSGAKPDYLSYLTGLAAELDTGIPWTMCHGQHINGSLLTCNGVAGRNDGCRKFSQQQFAAGQPAMFTEDEQWYDRYGQAASLRNSSSSARGMATFIALGGSLHNFYMWFGGNMYGNWSDTNRGSRLTPSYANSAAIASDGSVNSAKNKLLSDFHHLALKHADTILGTPIEKLNQTFLGNDPKCQQKCAPLCDGTCQWAVTMTGSGGSGGGGGGGSGTNAAEPISFLCNDDTSAASVSFMGKTHDLADRSCVVLDSAGAVLWNSHIEKELERPAPYTAIPSLAPGKLSWSSWNGNQTDSHNHTLLGTWYRTRFSLASPTSAADHSTLLSFSVNVSGFSSGNLFVNGFHLGFFTMAPGNCSKCSKGGFGCWPDGDYVPGGCGVPTQECFHIPPEVLVATSNASSSTSSAAAENELLIWSAGTKVCTPTVDENSVSPTACAKAEQNQMMPPSTVEPARASVVMRTIL
jgi:hypothetical protein